MAICPKCKSNVRTGVQNCPKCGTRIPAVGSDLIGGGALLGGGALQRKRPTATGGALGVGPTAGRNQVDLRYIVFRNGTLGLYARVLGWDGVDLTQAGVSSIVYTIYTLDRDGQRTAVTGHTAVALAKTAVLWDAVQSDGWASNWNFKFIPDIASVNAFAALGDVLVEVTVTPASGQKILVRFRNKVI